MNYQDKVVVLTGAAKGIGHGQAKAFAERGAKLALNDINEERLMSLVEELRSTGTEVLAMPFDVADAAAMQTFADRVFETYGRVDIMLNNAGVTSIGGIMDLPLSDWMRTYEVNTLSLIHAIQSFLPRMIAQDEECFFINTCSNSALMYGTSLIPAYAASKAAAMSLTFSLADAMTRMNTKVKVFCHSPGSVATEICQPDPYNVDRSDPYFSTDVFATVNTIVSGVIAAGMSVEDYVPAFFEHLERGEHFIRPCVSEQPVIDGFTDGIRTGQGPFLQK